MYMNCANEGPAIMTAAFKSKCKKQETFFRFFPSFILYFFLYFIPPVNDGMIDKLDETLRDHRMRLLILANLINKSQFLQ